MSEGTWNGVKCSVISNVQMILLIVTTAACLKLLSYQSNCIYFKKMFNLFIRVNFTY